MSKYHPHQLGHDLKTLAQRIERRHMIRLLGGASLLPLIGCGENAAAPSALPNATPGASQAGMSMTTTGAALPGASAGMATMPTTPRAGSSGATNRAGTAGMSSTGASAAGSGSKETAGGAGGMGSDGMGSTAGASPAAGTGADAAGNSAGMATAGRSGAPDSSPAITSCEVIPSETGGPYPGDGTNGANALIASGIVRSDIRSSFGGMSGMAAGVPLDIELTLVDTSADCAPLVGHAIYLWHCDREGLYSLYTIASQNYLRGVQATDERGVVTFKSIFPACYPGRWPHAHFEIFPSLDKAMSAGNRLKTSQLALPEDACKEVYAADGYARSVTTLSQVSLMRDMVFSDGATLQVATTTGDPSTGYVAKLTIGIAG